jgi:hypothetical protein
LCRWWTVGDGMVRRMGWKGDRRLARRLQGNSGAKAKKRW